MHFWIDKRSQTCGFSGRHRIPSSISSGSRSQIRPDHSGIWGGGSGHFRTSPSPTVQQGKPMVTPVHRFQSIESVASAAAASNSRLPRHHQQYRNHPHHLHHHNNRHHHHHHLQQHISPPVNNEHQTASNLQNHHQNPRNAVSPETTTHPNHLSTTELDNRRVYLDVPNVISDTINGPQLPPPMKVKCSSMWLSFGLLTLFAGGARLYSSNQVFVFGMLMLLLFGVTCYLSVCRTGHAWIVFETMVQQQQQINAAANAANARSANESTPGAIVNNGNFSEGQTTQDDPMLNTVLGGLQQTASNASTIQPPPPPPYHIAILLPQGSTAVQDSNESQEQRQEIDESPPPSYDKIIR